MNTCHHTKTALGRFLLKAGSRKLLNSVLQGLGSAELRYPHRLDLDGRTRTRVAACASCAGLRLEDAETCDGDLLATLEGVGNHRNNRLYCALSVSLCAADGLSYLLNQIHFICHIFFSY